MQMHEDEASGRSVEQFGSQLSDEAFAVGSSEVCQTAPAARAMPLIISQRA